MKYSVDAKDRHSVSLIALLSSALCVVIQANCSATEPANAVECLELFLKNATAIRENYALGGKGNITYSDGASAFEKELSWTEFRIADACYSETGTKNLGFGGFGPGVRSRRLQIGDKYFLASESVHARRSLIEWQHPVGLETQEAVRKFWRKSDRYRMPNPFACCLIGNTLYTTGGATHEVLADLVHSSMQIIDQEKTSYGFRGRWCTKAVVLEIKFKRSNNFMPSEVVGHWRKKDFNYAVKSQPQKI